MEIHKFAEFFNYLKPILNFNLYNSEKSYFSYYANIFVTNSPMLLQ